MNLAQQILVALGVPHAAVTLGHLKEKSRSHTKKGPGRVHLSGKPKKENEQ